MCWSVLLALALVCGVLNWLRRKQLVSGLHKKCVVITGCDSGFGNALAKSLYRRGVFVFAGCYTENGAKTLTKETGERLKTFRLDVSKTESIEESFEFVKENLPEGTVLWGLVNNAGIQGDNLPIEFSSKENIDRVMQVNCYGMVEMARAFLPLLKQSRGRIVNTVSLAGKAGVPYNHPYITSKYAMMGFSESLRREKRPWGIGVSSICPGGYITAILDKEDFIRRNRKCWQSAPVSLQAEYGQEYFDKHMEIQMSIIDGNPTDLSPVIECMEHALFARWQHTVYYPGTGSQVWAILFEYLPTPIVDFVLDNIFKQPTPKALQK